MPRLWGGLVLACTLASSLHAECREDRVALRGDWGELSFTVDIADDNAERAKGLMFVEQMGRNKGMLFIYPDPIRATFWMKNTLIPLDMIFVDSDGLVTHIHHEAIPGDLTAIDGGENVRVVLEINGGLAERYGIEPGSQMQHPVFSSANPVWPC